MTKFKFCITALLLICISISSCKESHSIQDKVTTTAAKMDSTAAPLSTTKEETKHSIAIEKIDSISFYEAQKSEIKMAKPLEQITDFKIAKKMLKNIVHFDKDQNVVQINFRNGTHFGDPATFNEMYFISYFPSEDILLCEGGHTSDFSFNLTTGKSTDETGNPTIIIPSPQNQFRFNGYTEGQDCYTYFIQKKTKSLFEKIISFDEAFKMSSYQTPCLIDKGFWTDDTTLYISQSENYDENDKPFAIYYKITILEQ